MTTTPTETASKTPKSDGLEVIRRDWEKHQCVMAEFRPFGTTDCLVVLRSRDNVYRYNCHRYIYFAFSDRWDVSVDHREVAIDQVMIWLQNHIPESNQTNMVAPVDA